MKSLLVQYRIDALFFIGLFLLHCTDNPPQNDWGVNCSSVTDANTLPTTDNGTLGFTAQSKCISDQKIGDMSSYWVLGFSPNNKLFIYLKNLSWTGLGDLFVWSIAEKSAIQLGKMVLQTRFLQFSPDSQNLVYLENYDPLTDLGDLTLYDFQKNKKREIAKDVWFTGVFVSPDWSKIVYINNSSTSELNYWTIASGEGKKIDHNLPDFPYINFSPDGNNIEYLVNVNTDENAGDLKIWNFKKKKHGVHSKRIWNHKIEDVSQFSEDSKKYVYIDNMDNTNKGNLYFIDLTTNQKWFIDKNVSTVDFWPNRYSLVYRKKLPGNEEGLFFWNCQTKKSKMLLEQSSEVSFFSPDKRRFYSFHRNKNHPRCLGMLQYYDIFSDTVGVVIKNVNSRFVISSDSQKIAFISTTDCAVNYGRLQYWNSETLATKQLEEQVRLSTFFEDVQFSPNSNYIIYENSKYELCSYSLQMQKKSTIEKNVIIEADRVKDMSAYSPDNKKFLYSGFSNDVFQLKAWDFDKESSSTIGTNTCKGMYIHPDKSLVAFLQNCVDSQDGIFGDLYLYQFTNKDEQVVENCNVRAVQNHIAFSKMLIGIISPNNSSILSAVLAGC